MANMSYVRFRNTLRDMRDCLDHVEDIDLSDDERAARMDLSVTAQKFLTAYYEGTESDDEEGDE